MFIKILIAILIISIIDLPKILKNKQSSDMVLFLVIVVCCIISGYYYSTHILTSSVASFIMSLLGVQQ